MDELLAIVDSLDTVAEPNRKFYEKKADGKFWLKVKAVGTVTLEDVGALKAANSEISAERTQLKARLASIPDNFDIAAAQAAMKKVDEIKNWKPDQKTQEIIDTQVAQVRDASEKEIKTLKTQLQEKDGHLGNLLMNTAADAGFLKHSFLDGGPEVLRPHVLAQMAVFEENGKPVARIKTDKGTVRYSLKPGSGSTPMEVDELLETMKAQKPFSHLFAGSGASGSGSKGSGGGGGGGDNKDLAGLKPSDRLAQIRRRQGTPTGVHSGGPAPQQRS